ncbi:hypothetical protein ACHAW6_003206 [Cyclotella cf. meneghiniana]
MRLSTPAKVGHLPKDVNGASASGNINYPTVVGMLLNSCSHSHPNILLLLIRLPDTPSSLPAITNLPWFGLDNALSTMEAEYVAFSMACKDLIPVVSVI